MTYLIINLALFLFLFNFGAAQLNDSSRIISNSTMPSTVEDIIINQEEGGDISREIIYPTRKDDFAFKPQINAISALTIDVKSGLVLFDKNSREKMPIASITKLMSALVFLDQQAMQGDKLSWEQLLEFSREDFRGGRRYLGVGEKVTIKDLFSGSLIGSANSATAALARSTGLTEDEFAFEMNKKAKELKMTDSSFSEPTGLDENNISTGRDLAKLIYAVMQRIEITEILKQTRYKFSPVNKRVTHKLNSTNWLIEDEWLDDNNYKLVGGKTGYTEDAGYTFACQIENDSEDNVISVILNTDNVNSRFDETKEIVQWSFENYDFGI
jgi:D-alanyl-D-alanine carboxypeptidase